MAMVSGSGGGALNPWAEPFVPSGALYGVVVPREQEEEVEDFSPEWWRLVDASPAFRDRWLRDYAALDDDAEEADGTSPLHLPDDELLPPSPPSKQGPARKVRAGGLEVAAWGMERWWRAHGAAPREKAPRKVGGGARVSPRPIQQPR